MGSPKRKSTYEILEPRVSTRKTGYTNDGKRFPVKVNYMYECPRIMQMREAGLTDLWNKKFQPDARKCLVKLKASKMKKQADKQLGLGNLIGSFVVLAIGFLVSLVVFVSEKIIFHRFKMLATTEKSSP